MTAALAAPVPLTVAPPPQADLIRVRMAPLVSEDYDLLFDDVDGDYAEAVVDMQLMVDYTSALARRAAGALREGLVERLDTRHQHPRRVGCLRCAIIGASRHATLAATLLEVLARANADEDWNNSPYCSDSRSMSRLRRIAISPATMENLYGPHWGAVMLMCLRIERADFGRLTYLVRHYQLGRIVREHNPHTMAAHWLAMTVCPSRNREGGALPAAKRNAIAACLAAAATKVAGGAEPEWLDLLPAPAL